MGRSVGDNLLSARLELAGLLVGEKEAVLISQEEARGDGVAADAHRSYVHGVPLGEIVYGTLGSGICRDLRQRPEGVH